MTFENDMPILSTAIWMHCHCHSALPFWATGKIAKSQPGKDFYWKRIFKKIWLLFFGANVNVLKLTTLQALWHMLKPLKH